MADEENVLTEEETQESSSPSEGMAKEIVDFDPRKPNRLNKRQFNNLVNLFDVFAENLASRLGDDLRLDMDVKISSITQAKYMDYVTDLPNPSILFEVDFTPMAAPSLIVLQHEIVFCALDRLLGGTGEVNMDARDLTEVESGIGDRLVEGVMASFASEWANIAPLTPSIRSRMSDPERISITDEKDIILVVVMDVSAGEFTFGALTLCLPFLALEEFLDKIGALDEKDITSIKGLDEWRGRICDNVIEMEIGLPVILGDAQIAIKDVLDLKASDVIVLEKKISEPVEMHIGTSGVVRGNVGLHNNRLAIKVMSVNKTQGAEQEPEPNSDEEKNDG